MTRQARFSASLLALAIVGFLPGCGGVTSRGDLWREHMGIRPDEPRPGATVTVPGATTTCQEYAAYVVYSQQLQEAYHSRASQNRAWIYVAGILGLGVVAAGGALAAATAVSVGTLVLLTISGGFSAASFATIDNPGLAQVYTISAKSLDEARSKADTMLPPAGRYTSDAACGNALHALKEYVSQARSLLEQSRTDAAVQALVRAREQQKTLNQLIAGQLPANPTRPQVTAAITGLSPTSPTTVGAPPVDLATQVTLTVTNILLNEVAQVDVTVQFGSQEIPIDGPAILVSRNTYTVKFTAPATAPDAPNKDYAPVLIVGKARDRVVGSPALKYTYH